MLEGNLYYNEEKDYWYLIDSEGYKYDVSNLIYALSALGHFDDESYTGEGEMFKVTLEVGGSIRKGRLA